MILVQYAGDDMTCTAHHSLSNNNKQQCNIHLELYTTLEGNQTLRNLSQSDSQCGMDIVSCELLDKLLIQLVQTVRRL